MMLLDLVEYQNRKSWAESFKDILEENGYNDVWLNQGVENRKYCFAIFKQRAQDIYLQEWNAALAESSRARTYRSFCAFSFQPYLNNIEKFRYALTRFRVSAHRLKIEAWRWHKPQKTPLENRNCKLCNVLEDEMHFLFECTLYRDLRQSYIKPYF